MTTLQPRKTLDIKLRNLNESILVLASMVEQATLKAVEVLKNRDIETAALIYRGDARINEKRFQIEDACLTVIATQQPMATDIRRLSSILDVSTELERMGDYAKGIARISIEMSNHPPFRFLPELSTMAELTVDMLHRAMTAFVEANEDAARSIPLEDDNVDVLYNKVNRELIAMAGNDPSIMDRANYIMWAAHNLERMADRVTNICERTIFIKTGKLIELDSTEDEMRGK